MRKDPTDPIYLDFNATTPIDPGVANAMLPYLHEHFGNPSSGHVYGQRAKQAVELARDQMASLLGCTPEEIVFTSGGTESNNQVLFGVTAALAERGRHIVTSRVEHPAILEPCLVLMEHGFDVTFVPVDKYGQVRVAEVEAALRPDTVLVSIMHANNEVGTLQPIADIAHLSRSRNIVLHTDAAQSVGKIATRVDDLGVDLLTVAAHKLYAPKGVGALYVRDGTPIKRWLHGAGQEKGRRPGTENVLEIVGLGEAAAIARARGAEETLHLQRMRDLLQEGLRVALPDVVVHGHPQQRLPNTLSVAFPGCRTDQLLAGLQGVAASAGAACHADTVKVSHVLEAMRIPMDLARGTLRFSVGRFTTAAEIEQAVQEIVSVVNRLRSRA
jgi:cysteine desulfurase